MHEERLVKDRLVECRVLGLPHEHLRGLRESGEELVRRLGRVNHGVARASALIADRVHTRVQLVEARVGQPCLIEVQRIDVAVEGLRDFFSVVDDAVVGALREGKHARLLRLVGDEGVGIDLCLNGFWRELRARNRADDAREVARRGEEDRDGPRQDDRVQHRRVAVAVNDHDVSRADERVPDDLVRRRCAIRHEEQVIGLESAGGALLGLRDRAGVIEQLTALFDRVAHVRAQQVLAEELMEERAGRAIERATNSDVSSNALMQPCT